MKGTRFESTTTLPGELVDLIVSPDPDLGPPAIEDDPTEPGGRLSMLKSAALWANNIRYRGTEPPDVEALNEDMPGEVVTQIRASLPRELFTPRGNAHQAVWRLMNVFRGMANEKRQEESLIQVADRFRRDTPHLRPYPAYAAHQLERTLLVRQREIADEIYDRTMNTKITHDVATAYFVKELCLTTYDKPSPSGSRLVRFEDAVEAAKVSTEDEFTHLEDMHRELRPIAHAVIIDGGRKYGDVFGVITRFGLTKAQTVRLGELSRMVGHTAESFAITYGRNAWEFPAIKDEYRRLSTASSFGWVAAISLKPSASQLIR